MSSKNKSKIGIIGLGIVGKTLFDWLKKNNYEVYGYDKFKKIGGLEEVDRAKIIFFCLPTPFDQKSGYKLDALTGNIEYFKKPKIFVIRSTVLPGTTEKFQKKYKKHSFLFNPEFLREADPWGTYINTDLQIIGYTKKSKKFAKQILKLLPKAKNLNTIMPATEAEIIKQAVNSFLAIKVIFANQIYELTKKFGANYNFVRKGLENERRLGKSHFDVMYNGYQGFGGKCLPKDLNALIFHYKNLKLKPEPFKTIWEINLQYLKKQKLLKRLFEDWFNNKN
ncbi:MAG: NAD(P)-binding domain-containing protein [Minisyncoccia bacterium]